MSVWWWLLVGLIAVLALIGAFVLLQSRRRSGGVIASRGRRGRSQ